MGRGSKNGVKCCPGSSSSSSSISESSEGSITSTSSDSNDFADCTTCGPNGTPPPYSWLMDFSGLQNHATDSCSDCPNSTQISVIAPFTSSVFNGGTTYTCNYGFILPCQDHVLLCNTASRSFYFVGCSVVLSVTNNILQTVTTNLSFRTVYAPDVPCTQPSNSCGYIIIHRYVNTENKNCHDNFLCNYLSNTNTCPFGSLCVPNTSSTVDLSPMF